MTSQTSQPAALGSDGYRMHAYLRHSKVVQKEWELQVERRSAQETTAFTLRREASEDQHGS